MNDFFACYGLGVFAMAAALFVIFIAWRMGRNGRTSKEERKQLRHWYLSHFAFFSLRQALLPFSTVKTNYYVGNRVFYTFDAYVFGFRILRLHTNKT
jgi:hypothetical protein